MVGHSTTRAPSVSKSRRNSADCVAARVIRTVLPASSIPGNFGKDFSRSHIKQPLTEGHTQFRRAVRRSCELLPNHAAAIKARNQAFYRETVACNRCLAGDRNLTASAQGTEQIGRAHV